MNNVTFNPKKNYSRRTPSAWKRVSDAVKYFFVSAIGLITVADFIPQPQNKWIVFALSMAILLLKSIDLSLGYKVEDNQPKQ